MCMYSYIFISIKCRLFYMYNNYIETNFNFFYFLFMIELFIWHDKLLVIILKVERAGQSIICLLLI